MEEKIKIYISNKIYQILLKDMELFEFYKNNHSLNKNDFINKLINNYYERYATSSLLINHDIKQILNNFINDDLDNLTSKITDYIAKQNLDIEKNKFDITISIKPTKKTAKAFDYINNFLLKNISLSGWLRNLLASYTKLPQDERERIIFKENFDEISKALTNDKKIYFKLKNKNKDTSHCVSCYSISSSKEELFNYLLCEENDHPRAFRISRMYNIIILNDSAKISNTAKIFLDKMQKFGPQFSYDPSENGIIKIKFSEKGKYLYDRMYIHRPNYSYIEDDTYIFECSIMQAKIYFQRFGKDAIIIEPTSLAHTLENHYYNAYKAYKKYQDKLN